MRMTYMCSHIFNGKFVHLLYKDGQEIGKRCKPNISKIKKKLKKKKNPKVG